MSVLLQIHGHGNRRPSLREAARQLHMQVEQLDRCYGVKVIDPWSELYVVRSTADEAAAHGAAHEDPPIGIFTR